MPATPLLWKVQDNLLCRGATSAVRASLFALADPLFPEEMPQRAGVPSAGRDENVNFRVIELA